MNCMKTFIFCLTNIDTHDYSRFFEITYLTGYNVFPVRFTVLTQECKIVPRLKQRAYGEFRVIWNVFEMSRDEQIYGFFAHKTLFYETQHVLPKKTNFVHTT